MAETASKYKKRLAATLRGGFTPACINDTEIPTPYVLYSCSQLPVLTILRCRHNFLITPCLKQRKYLTSPLYKISYDIAREDQVLVLLELQEFEF